MCVCVCDSREFYFKRNLDFVIGFGKARFDVHCVVGYGYRYMDIIWIPCIDGYNADIF